MDNPAPGILYSRAAVSMYLTGACCWDHAQCVRPSTAFVHFSLPIVHADVTTTLVKRIKDAGDFCFVVEPYEPGRVEGYIMLQYLG